MYFGADFMFACAMWLGTYAGDVHAANHELYRVHNTTHYVYYNVHDTPHS